MKWNVILRDSESGKFKPYNIFEHSDFRLSIENLFSKQYSKEQFLKALDQQIHDFFSGKPEQEIVFTTWPPYINAEEIERIISEYHINRTVGQTPPENIYINVARWQKVDIYDQLRANWERFAEYVWKQPKTKNTQKLCWNVYEFNNSNQGLKIFNVFDHRSFKFYVEKLLKKDLSKEDFAEQLRREAQYYYWAKCEWELIINDTRPHINRKELDRIISECYLKLSKADPPCRRSHVNLAHSDKIDVYDQLCLNWDEFVDYVWSYTKSQRNTSPKK